MQENITSSEFEVEISELLDFSRESLAEISQNRWVKDKWPIVYFITNQKQRIAYVGESTHAGIRFKTHLLNPLRSILNKISIIGSDQFNKSASLDIESSLIEYIHADNTYKLQNGNYGLVDHTYYQKDKYRKLFNIIWEQLLERKIVSKSLMDIENSEIFKYSPYKALNEDQYTSVIQILTELATHNQSRIIVNGGAGTGKTVLATYLIKLLKSDVSNINDEELDEAKIREINLIRDFQRQYPTASIGLVIAMTPLRETLKKVFKNTPGLSSTMVISPSDTFKKKYDLLIVDEAHRLRQYRNISWQGIFRQNNKKLGLDDTGTELDWIIANSRSQIFFYDPAQTIKPSDIHPVLFQRLLSEPATTALSLKSQMRVKGGIDYIQFVENLLQVRTEKLRKYADKNYQLILFDSLPDLYTELEKHENEAGLCRLVAGYSWQWLSKKNRKAIDIELNGLKFQWNQTLKDWINTPTAFREIGCIHTTQGYDLNYTGVIFGKEIDYNPKTRSIEILGKHYHDENGKKSIRNPEELKSYVLNIYSVLMSRGIRGTFVYACNKPLRDYLKQFIPSFIQELPFRAIQNDEVKPYVNSIPLVDISAAAGSFSEVQIHSEMQWVQLEKDVAIQKDHFVCQVIGESMNSIIPNGALCLFHRDRGGSRNGKIVLVQSTEIQDADSGSSYTVKEYHSEKVYDGEGWHHTVIRLKPLSDNEEYQTIELTEEELTDFAVVGIFERVLE